jgi:hypothetical protein
LVDATAFSIIFSPSGKLVLHDVTIRNKDGKTEGTQTSTISNDQVFNTYTKITHLTDPYGMFVQDEDAGNPQAEGLERESSRNSFVIYDRKTFAGYFNNHNAYSEYLENLEIFYINAYTGTIIDK